MIVRGNVAVQAVVHKQFELTFLGQFGVTFLQLELQNTRYDKCEATEETPSNYPLKGSHQYSTFTYPDVTLL